MSNQSRLQFDVKMLLAATALCAVALVLAKWLADLFNAMGSGAAVLICPLSFFVACALVGTACDRASHRSGLRGGALGGVLPALFVVVFGPGVDCDVDLQHSVLFLSCAGVYGAVLAGLCSLALDGVPRDVSVFFYWSWRSAAPIAVCTVALLAWSQFVAPYRTTTLSCLNGKVSDSDGSPQMFVYYRSATVVVKADRTIDWSRSPQTYFASAIALIAIVLLALLWLHRTQTPHGADANPLPDPSATQKSAPLSE